MKIRLAIFAAVLVAQLLIWWPDAEGHHSTEKWRELVEKILPNEDTNRVLRIMWCESRGDPNVRYTEEWGHDSVGLMQINTRWLDGWGKSEWAIPSHDGTSVDLTDPVQNLMATKWIRYHEDYYGMRPWQNWACQ